MKGIRDTIKEVQYRKMLKHLFEPRKEFLERSRGVFLDEVAKRRVAPLAPQIRWRSIGVKSLQYMVVFAIVALVGTSGLVAFADSQNVEATHPLYQFKRIGEQVRLTIAPKQSKHLLHEEFAKRRAEEVRQITAIVQTETDGARDRHEQQIAKIQHEFKKDIEDIAAIPDIDKKFSPMRIEALCATKAEVESQVGDDDMDINLQRFDARCATLKGNTSSTDQIAPVNGQDNSDEIRQGHTVNYDSEGQKNDTRPERQ